MDSIASPAGLLSLVIAAGLPLWSSAAVAGSRTRTVPAPSEPLVVKVDDGSSWADTGIGAAGGFGAALVLAGSLALAGRKHRSTSQPPRQEEP